MHVLSKLWLSEPMSPAFQGPFPRQCLPFLSWSQRRIWLRIVFLGQGVSGGCGKNVKFRIPIKYNKIIVTMRDISLGIRHGRIQGRRSIWNKLERTISINIYPCITHDDHDDINPCVTFFVRQFPYPWFGRSSFFFLNHVSVWKEAMFANPPLVVFLVIFIILGSFGLLDSTIREMGRNPWSFVGSEVHIKVIYGNIRT